MVREPGVQTSRAVLIADQWITSSVRAKNFAMTIGRERPPLTGSAARPVSIALARRSRHNRAC
jgi:hypothetical protein